MSKTTNKIQKNIDNAVNQVLTQRYNNLSFLNPTPRIPKESYSTVSSSYKKYGSSKK